MEIRNHLSIQYLFSTEQWLVPGRWPQKGALTFGISLADPRTLSSGVTSLFTNKRLVHPKCAGSEAPSQGLGRRVFHWADATPSLLFLMPGRAAA